MIVVEDQDERRLDARRQRFEISAGEDRDVRVELRRELRQELAIEVQSAGSCEPEVMEECRQIAIAAIELVPQMRQRCAPRDSC